MHVVATVAARIHALSELSVRFQPDRFSSWPGSAEVDECRKECQRRVRQRRLQDPAPPLPCVSFVDTFVCVRRESVISDTSTLWRTWGVGRKRTGEFGWWRDWCRDWLACWFSARARGWNSRSATGDVLLSFAEPAKRGMQSCVNGWRSKKQLN